VDNSPIPPVGRAPSAKCLMHMGDALVASYPTDRTGPSSSEARELIDASSNEISCRRRGARTWHDSTPTTPRGVPRRGGARPPHGAPGSSA